MLTVLRIVVICALAFLGFTYYGLVLPDRLATLIAILMAGSMLLTMTFSQAALGAIVKGGFTLVAWPAGAFLAGYIMSMLGVELSRAETIAAAPITAAIFGAIACSIAKERDRARDLATISMGLICLYTIFYVATFGDDVAMMIACFSTAFCAYILKQQLIIPPLQEKALLLFIAAPIFSAFSSLLFF